MIFRGLRGGLLRDGTRFCFVDVREVAGIFTENGFEHNPAYLIRESFCGRIILTVVPGDLDLTKGEDDQDFLDDPVFDVVFIFVALGDPVG